MTTSQPDPTPQIPYSIDEVLLVAEVGYSADWPQASAVEEKLVEISELLRGSYGAETQARNPKLRNFNGIKRKYNDLLTRRPNYEGEPTRGGVNDLYVIGFFETFREEAFNAARKARDSLR